MTRLVVPLSRSSTSMSWYVKSRGLDPVTCSEYGPSQVTLSSIVPLTNSVSSVINSVLERLMTICCIVALPEKNAKCFQYLYCSFSTW